MIDNREFNLVHWYAKKRAIYLNMQRPSTKDFPAFQDNPYCFILTLLLQNGINSHFPNVKSDTESDFRFFVHKKDYGSSIYVIHDDDLGLKIEIEKSLLDDQHFDFIQRYIVHVMMSEGRYKDQYVINHKHHYCPIPDGYQDMYFELPELLPDEDASDSDEELDLKEIIQQIHCILNKCQPYPGDDTVYMPIDPTYIDGESRFHMEIFRNNLYIYDRVRGFDARLIWNIATWEEFSIGKWYAERCAQNAESDLPYDMDE
jgi:hypothetical protein